MLHLYCCYLLVRLVWTWWLEKFVNAFEGG